MHHPDRQNTLKKAHKSGEDVYLALLSLNTTPRKDGTSPAFKLFHRQPQTTLPVTNGNTKPVKPSANKWYTNPTRGRDLPEIAPGTTLRIWINREKSWEQKGIGVKRHEEPHPYNVLNSKGNIVRRNRRPLMPTKEPFQVSNNHDEILPSSTPSTPELQAPVQPLVQPESELNTEPSQNKSANPVELKTSRFGRKIRKPARFAEYVSQ